MEGIVAVIVTAIYLKTAALALLLLDVTVSVQHIQ